MKKLTISIVNYNAGQYLEYCLRSLKELKDEVSFDVFVIDNNSTDGSIENEKNKFPEFNFIVNKENLGFGRAHNQILKRAKTKYLLVLNPDTRVPKKTLSFLINYMDENSDVGLTTPRLEKEDGSLDKASHRGFPTPLTSFLYFFLKNDRFYHLTDRDMSKIHEIDSAVGAFMLMRKSVLEKVGYFDEDYFLYGEDLDLCFRIKQNGFKIMFVPSVRAFHTKGISSGIKRESKGASKASDKTKLASVNYFNEVMGIFYRKHYAKNYPFFFNWFVYFGIYLKSLMTKMKKTV